MSKTCPTCEGSCEVSDTGDAEDLVKCPECNGTGEVPETYQVEKECIICGESMSITMTENDKVMPHQFKGSLENPKHISCTKQRAIEQRNARAMY